MKCKDINIFWNRGGPIEVSDAWDLPEYFYTIGKCCSGWNKYQMLIDALHIIIRDQVDPMALHRELLKVDEYRDMCANDMPELWK